MDADAELDDDDDDDDDDDERRAHQHNDMLDDCYQHTLMHTDVFDRQHIAN